MAETLVTKIKERLKDLESQKQPWLVLYDAVNTFIRMRSQSVRTIESQKYLQTQFIPDCVYDSTAMTANFQMASSLIGALYPNADRSFVYKPSYSVPPELAASTKVKEWYEGVTQKIRQFMAAPGAKFIETLTPYMNEQGSAGTSGIAMLDNYDNDKTCPFVFRFISINNVWISEDINGCIDTVYVKRWLTCRQIIEEYGSAASPTVRDYYKNGKFEEKFLVLTATEPRPKQQGMSQGNDSYPVASYHMEFENDHILKNEGFHEMFIFMVRFIRMDTLYGWCPGMTALPDIFELNSKREAEIIATDKYLDPPLLVKPTRLVNNGVVNSSAGALNAEKESGNPGEDRDPPVKPMILTGELVSTGKRIDTLQNTVKDAFFTDDLRELTTERSRMTLGEAKIMAGLRAQALVQIYNQQLNELFRPVLHRAFNIALKHGLLGLVEGSQAHMDYVQKKGRQPRLLIPKEIAELMADGEDVYDLEFISPAGRMLRIEELEGIQQTAGAAIQAAEGGATTCLDVVNWDQYVMRTQHLTGAPSELIKSVQDIAELRKQKDAAFQKQAAMEAQGAGAHTFKAVAQGAKAATEAGIDPAQLMAGQQQ